jgi:hypothetical protein
MRIDGIEVVKEGNLSDVIGGVRWQGYVPADGTRRYWEFDMTNKRAVDMTADYYGEDHG